MILSCAWCQHDKDGPSSASVAEPHRICWAHRQRLLTDVQAAAADSPVLIVVSPGAARLFDHVFRFLDGRAGVRVILDRRLAVNGHRGADERRTLAGCDTGLGYTIVRLPARATAAV
jgi:hypothetical protein